MNIIHNIINLEIFSIIIKFTVNYAGSYVN